MRHKKHLSERLGRVKNLLCVDKSEKNSLLSKLNPHYLSYAEIFGNPNPVVVDLGCGFGSFSRIYAERFPGRNVIAVEKDPNVIVSACEMSEGIPNLRYIDVCGKYLQTYFPPHSVYEIHLNFPTPYQKESYAKNRLTHKAFLDIYADILREEGMLFFKTDNARLYEFSLEQLSIAGWTLKATTEDLHASEWDNENIVTEYEKKFSGKGFKIKYIEAFKARS